MANRVTEGLLYGQSQDSVTKSRSNLIKNQEMAVSGKKVNRPSDDPVAATRVISLKSSNARTEQVSQNLELAQSIMNMTDASLGELGDLISRAKELGIQMSSSTNDAEDARLATAHEIDQLLLRAVQIGNTRLGERYIFGGYQTTRAPFDQDGNYYGDQGVIELEVDQGQRIGVNMPGMAPFFGVEGVSQQRQDLRHDPANDKTPTISGQLRSPASLVAEAQGIDPEQEPEAYAKIQQKTGVNVFNVLKNFSEGLNAGDRTRIHESLDGLDLAFRQVVSSRALIGARTNALKSGMEGLENTKVMNAELISNVEDADTMKVFSDMTRTENTLKAALETNKRILNNSLGDFLK